MGKLFLLFTIVPFVELLLLMRLSAMMGFGTTILLVIVTGMLGASLARAQGLKVLRDWQDAMAAGRVPESGVTDALLVVVGGVLLVTPGVLTDVLGLLLMVKGPRRAIGALLARYVKSRIERGDVQVQMGGFPGTGHGVGHGGPFAGPSDAGRSPLKDAAPKTPPRPVARGVRDDDVIRVQATVRDVEDK